MPKKNIPKDVLIIPEEIEFYEPTNENSKYDPSYDDQLMKHLAKGLSFHSFDVGVSSKTMRQWLKKHPSFALARERGEKKRLQLLEAAGMKMIVEGNAVAWKFMMQQELGLSDINIKIDNGGGSDKDDADQLEKEIIDVTPERTKRLAKIREYTKKLKIK